MTNTEAIGILENMAIDLTGALMQADVRSSAYVARKIEAIDMAQAALERANYVAQNSAKGSHVYIVGERKRPESEEPKVSVDRFEAIKETMAKYMNGSHYTMADIKEKMTGGT